MRHSLTKLFTLIVMGTFAVSLGMVVPAQARLVTTLAPTTEEPQFHQSRMVIRGHRGYVKMVMNGVPDAIGSPCAVVFTLSVNSGENFELELECEIVDVIDRHHRHFDQTPNYAVLRATIADKIDPPLEDGDLIRFGGADVFINGEYRATVGGIYIEPIDSPVDAEQ